MNEQLLFQLVFDVLGQDGVDKLRAAMDAAKKSAGDLSPELQAAANEIDGLTSKASKVEGFAALKAQTTETALKLQEAKAGLAALNSEFDRSDTSSAKVTRAFSIAEQQVANLTLQHNGLSAQLARSGAELERSGISTKNLAAAHAELASKVSVASQNFIALSSASGGHVSALQSLRNGASAVGGALKTAGEHALEFGKRLLEISGIATLIGSALAVLTGEKIFGEGIKQADEFEHSITKAGIAVNASADELDALGKAAEDAASKTHVSAADAAAALAVLAKGAGSANAAIAELAPTLLLAKAAQIEVAQAADILGTAIAEFGLKASDSSRVVDILAKTAGTTKSDLGELSAAFGKVAPDAKAAGVSIEETAALFGALSDQGIRGRKATQDLTAIFQEMANPTSKLREQLLSLGLSGDSLSTVLKKLSGNSAETQRVVEALGTKGGSAFRALVAASPDIQRLNVVLGQSGGAAQATADKFDKELGGAFTNFKNAFVDAAKALATPLLKPLAEQLTLAAAAVRDFIKTADFAKIRDAVLDFTTTAIKAIREFFGNLDFRAASASIADFTKSAGDSLKGFSSGLSVVGATASTVGNSVAVIFNLMSSVIAGSVAAIVRGIQYGETAALGLAKLRGATEKELVAMAREIENVKQTADDLNERSKASWDAAGKNLENIAGALNRTGTAAADAKPKLDQHAAAMDQAGEAAKGAADGTNHLADAADRAVPTIVAMSRAQVDATNSARDLKTAAGTLGISLQSDLKKNADDAAKALDDVVLAQQRGVATIEDVRRAYAAFAQAQRAAIADSDATAKAAGEELIAEKGYALDLGDALRKAGQAGIQQGEDTAAGARKAGQALKGAASAAKEAGDNVKDMAGGGGESLAKLDEALATTRAGFLQMSEAAAKAFDAHLVSDFNLEFDSTGIGLGRTIAALNDAAEQTKRDIDTQRQSLDDLIGSLDNAGTAGRAAFGDIGQYAGRSVGEIQGMIDSIKNGTSQFNLLGQQDLDRLLSALDAAKQKAQAAADAAKQAAGEFDNLAKSIHDQLLQEQGDQQDLENERHQEQLDKLKELADSGQIDAQKYAQAVADENALHDLKLKHLDEQKKKDEQNQKDQQQRDQNQQSGGGGSGGGSSNSGGAGTGGGGGKNGGGGQQSASSGVNGGLPSGITHHVHITVNGNEIDAFADQQNADALANVLQQLRFAKGRS